MNTVKFYHNIDNENLFMGNLSLHLFFLQYNIFFLPRQWFLEIFVSSGGGILISLK